MSEENQPSGWQGPVERQALQRLLEYIQDERDKRCARIIEDAKAEANAIVKDARILARHLVHGAIAAERLRRNRVIERTRAEVRTRLRRTWFRLIRRELDQAWPLLVEATVRHWNESASNRRAWLSATLETATHALGPGLWHVEHPEHWPMFEGAPVFKALRGQYEVLEIHCRPSAQLAGFRVSCGDVSVSTTVDGLLSPKSRIEGIWLGILGEENVLTQPSLLQQEDPLQQEEPLQ